MKRRFFFSALGLLGISLLWIGCVRTAANRNAFIMVSENKMQAMGSQAYQQLRQKEKRTMAPKFRSPVVRIGTRIARVSGKRFRWEFEVFDAPKKVNAFCLPGGKIGVYTGIFRYAVTEAGLAAVMGHEVAHATLRHGAERVSQAMATNVGMSIANAFLGGSRNGKVLMAALGVGAQVGVILPYSRSHESEADRIGLVYMAKAGYDPREAVSLWVRMSRAGKLPPEFLSTHPDPLKRARLLKQQLRSVMPIYQRSQRQARRRLPPI